MPVLDNPRHEKFAQLMAKGGKTATEAYMEAMDASLVTARGNAYRFMENDGIADRIKEIQLAAEKRVQWSLAERLKFCADVAKTPIGEVDENSPLCQSAEYHETGRKFKMPDKLRAVELYTKLAGDGAPDELKVGVDDPILSLLKLTREGKDE